MTHVSGWSEKCLFDWGVIFGWKRWKYASIRPGRSEEIVREPLAALRAVGGGVCGIICLRPSHRLLSPHPASIMCPLFSRAVLGTEDTAEKKEGKTQHKYYSLHIFWAPGGSCKWSWSPPTPRPQPCCSEAYLPNRAQKTQCVCVGESMDFRSRKKRVVSANYKPVSFASTARNMSRKTY